MEHLNKIFTLLLLGILASCINNVESDLDESDAEAALSESNLVSVETINDHTTEEQWYQFFEERGLDPSIIDSGLNQENAEIDLDYLSFDYFNQHFIPGINQGDELGIGVIQYLNYHNRAVRKLKLVGKRTEPVLCLTGIPLGITGLTNLYELDLQSHQLPTIPPEISQLTNLYKLDLSDNELSDISPTISCLSSLRQLDLSYNGLRELPPQLGQLTDLTELNVSYNELVALPSEIGSLIKLKKIKLTENQLAELPSAIGNLSSLNSLTADFNRITKLPSTISNLKNLSHVNLDYNLIDQLPPTICQLSRLEALELREFQGIFSIHTQERNFAPIFEFR